MTDDTDDELTQMLDDLTDRIVDAAYAVEPENPRAVSCALLYAAAAASVQHLGPANAADRLEALAAMIRTSSGGSRVH